MAASAFSRRYEKSGRIEVDPVHVRIGEHAAHSRSAMIVRSGSSAAPCSIAMQLRPICAEPTEEDDAVGDQSGSVKGWSATGCNQTGVDVSCFVFEAVGLGPHRESALPDGMTERS